MKQIANLVAMMGLVASAGCTASGPAGQINTGNADTAIFQKGMTDVSGSSVGLIGTKTIALTFDDGPMRGRTDDLLNFLADEGVKATFFMVGKQIIGNDYLLERMSDEGHSLGNHTFDHTPIVKMSKSNMNGVYKEIAQNDALISPHLRTGKHIFFRSPGGSWTNLIAQAMNNKADIADKYIGPVFWDIGGTSYFLDDQGRKISGTFKKYDASTGLLTLANQSQVHSTKMWAAADWDCGEKALNVPAEMCADGYLSEIERRQGGVVLMHDTHARTIEMVKLLVPRLKALGYSFITLDELPNIQKFE